MKNLLFSTALLFLSTVAFSQTAKKYDEVSIKTSAVCKMCKERIERDLSLTKGVEEANLNVDSKIVWVKYKTSKTSADAIRKAISEIGYDADTVAANDKAHDRLPDCCQKSAEPHVD